MPLALAVLSSVCFGVALVTGRIGLRSLDARAGAAISIPTAAILFLTAAPFALDTSGFTIRAVLVFAAVGLFFPAVVTLLTFRSNETLGPTITGAVSGTAPLFALLAAAFFLGERVPTQVALAAVGVVVGVAMLSWNPRDAQRRFTGAAMLWPIAGALVRGLSQAAARAGLLLWPNPFAAGLIGYCISSAVVIGASGIGRAARPRFTRSNVAWFALTGLLNGSALLLMYHALSAAPVSLVAPVVAGYPLVTAMASAVVLRDEQLTPRLLAGAAVTVAAIAYLVASGSA